MITCQHARRLFDRSLDDELSPSLKAELHAHRLHCSQCQSELALDEACADVIRLDTCEPALSASFTDRVMTARRTQLASRSRHWQRVVLFTGSGLAVAASIAIAFLLSSPMPQEAPAPHEGITAGIAIAAPKQFQKNVLELTGKKLDPQTEAELANTPEMKALPFMDSFLALLVKGTRNTAEATRHSVDDLTLLLRYGFANMNDQLVAEYREKYPDDPRGSGSNQRVISDLDFLGPAFFHPAFSTPESTNTNETYDTATEAI